jgi:aryl-alcohol dehydrogenase-like predicted oxidoreductase
MNRREFIKKTAAIAPMLSLFPADLSFIVRQDGLMEKRSLGRTGVMLSVIGFGGIIVRNATAEQASGSVRNAIDAGVNYFDVAPSYGDAEEKLGPALQPFRNKVFLSNKTGKRTRDEARQELERSLKLLRTDYFDLYQLHAVTSMEDVETIFSKGGAMETLLEAREEGKAKYLGFSAHSVEAAKALMEGFDFDTIMFPFNLASWYAGNFGPQVLEMAHQKQMGILALKAMAKGKWQQGTDRSTFPKIWYEPLMSEEEIVTGLRFSLSHPITCAIPPGEEGLFEKAIAVKDRLHPMKKEEIDGLKQKVSKWDPLFQYNA